MKVVLATRNEGKLVELRRILVDIDVVGLEEFPDAPDVPETELTFAGNALLKAHAIAEHTGLPSVADDSGLCVDALNGMPGVFSARWSGRHGDDEANLDLLLGQLSDVALEHRGARFVCVAAVAWPSGEEQTVEGELTGHVVGARRGTNGFGYDPIFVPDDETRTTAELDPEEKDAISHRGKAFRALSELLRQSS
ncbi:RdgB/HAM1 family non-canonical purine NTP pyrophosphatase [Actinomadura sp. DC4]|uniref:RdgB/HAM1 family non-canonical purine NTP pyrophosphatase n=1 Tax=Actinomadura sp. DC4 TaxID=3055069 RepID=UPI0025AF352B|nr:RdgB/HAM1 family non-canonical purine NTP pyrophosphatase [Actinomadura sp. DC4]MDN3351693.1 RdgB/HAM1 family non-canonical purine NTP pyrophosphatase [Actinomadura sp. DC4]